MSDATIRKILVPVDGSPSSLKAAEHAVKIARGAGAEILLIHVIGAAPYVTENGMPVIYPEQYYADVRVGAAKWFDSISEIAAKNNVRDKIVKSEVILVHTSIADGILDYAEKTSADLIVVGSTGVTGIKRFVIGSVSNNLVHHARCPVLVVR